MKIKLSRYGGEVWEDGGLYEMKLKTFVENESCKMHYTSLITSVNFIPNEIGSHQQALKRRVIPCMLKILSFSRRIDRRKNENRKAG
jgi:hypothetical protein